MSDACTEGSLRPNLQPEVPEKNYNLTLKTIGCERKCRFFHFLLRKIEI